LSNLKAVIFGISDVLAVETGGKRKIAEQTTKLMQYLDSNGLDIVTIGNSEWTVGGRPLLKVLSKRWGIKVKSYQYGQDGFPAKQSSAALEQIRNENGWQANETIYVGNSDADMRSAVNGKTLFLNASWYGENTEYGFKMKTPKWIARFVDIFCLREHWWFFSIEKKGLSVFALAPFSTYKKPEFSDYSNNFITTVKGKLGQKGDVNFWAKYLCTSLYFSGVYQDVNYIAPYPGHKPDSVPPVLEQPMSVFAKCFRKKYIPDLVIRHTKAVESKRNRASANFDNQLNTIFIKATPRKSATKNFVRSPLNSQKTVLVLDDIITEGYSLEAARAFIESTGAKVICVGLLKTLNRGYHQIQEVSIRGRTYGPCKFSNVGAKNTFAYGDHITDREAPTDLSDRLNRYKDWNWPN